ncbi:MAG TPA: glycine--tRNA ligase subunit beta [Burkholderiaceae bacterium]|nr:glycine--tRNA ligase subunit beta [Burkholderiaceae bacterium]
MNQTLLVELLTEELPPKALAKLGEAFADRILNGLHLYQLTLPISQGVLSFATPRRLAVAIPDVLSQAPDRTESKKLMPIKVAFDSDGKPTAALLKRLEKEGASAEQVERKTEGDIEYAFVTRTIKGVSLAVGLQEVLEDAVTKLPIPKTMSYQLADGETTVHFVRPAHALVALHGTEVVPVSVLGLQAGRVTLGHRFLSQGQLSIVTADGYASTLQEGGKVIADVGARKEKIRSALLAKAGSDKVLMPESLLDEVTALVEWPVVYECNFESEFLSVPQECLILTMQTNQKYFALTDADGRLRSRFLIVSNLATDDPQHIIRGNERVVRPRLSDAKFFFEQDKKKKLADRLPGLASVVYHNKLGTQAQRTERVKTLAGKIAQALSTDVARAERGALLAKTDLLTDMVGEFPELQGIMGTYYARHDGEHEDVARAISEHYRPRFAGDTLPVTDTGTAVALADKLETLVGIWGIGLQPTGDKDPFALRRHALGILRMLIEKRLPLSLGNLLADSAQLFADNPNFKLANAEMITFLHERLRGLLRERCYAQNEIEAVVAQNPDRLDNIIERLDAVQAFAALPEAASLAAANKRITNILKKTDGATRNVQTGLLREAAEEGLYSAMTLLKPQVDASFSKGDFTGTLKALARLRQNVDAFFTDVMVITEDEQLRNNRIALLSNLHGMMNQVADISKLAA